MIQAPLKYVLEQRSAGSILPVGKDCHAFKMDVASLVDVNVLLEHVRLPSYSLYALAPGGTGPVDGLQKYFEEELHEHISSKCCPFSGARIL